MQKIIFKILAWSLMVNFFTGCTASIESLAASKGKGAGKIISLSFDESFKVVNSVLEDLQMKILTSDMNKGIITAKKPTTFDSWEENVVIHISKINDYESEIEIHVARSTLPGIAYSKPRILNAIALKVDSLQEAPLLTNHESNNSQSKQKRENNLNEKRKNVLTEQELYFLKLYEKDTFSLSWESSFGSVTAKSSLTGVVKNSVTNTAPATFNVLKFRTKIFYTSLGFLGHSSEPVANHESVGIVSHYWSPETQGTKILEVGFSIPMYKANNIESRLNIGFGVADGNYTNNGLKKYASDNNLVYLQGWSSSFIDYGYKRSSSDDSRYSVAPEASVSLLFSLGLEASYRIEGFLFGLNAKLLFIQNTYKEGVYSVKVVDRLLFDEYQYTLVQGASHEISVNRMLGFNVGYEF